MSIPAPRTLAAGAAALGLVLVLGALPARGDDEASNAELERLRARIQALQENIDRDRGLQDELGRHLEETERRWVALSAELRGLRRQIAEQSEQRRRTAAERQQAEAELERQRSVLARQIRAAYVIGQRGQAKLLLNQDRMQELSRVVTYYDYLNRARGGRIREVLGLVGKLRTLEQRLGQETAALEATRARHEGTLTALEAARAERQEMVKQLARRITYEESELKTLRANERRLRRLIEELQTALADIPGDLGSKPFETLRGRLPWPVKGRLLAHYGQPKASGALKWNGLWIAGREGDPVKAVARGRVAYVGWMHRYGLITVLEHEGGYYSLYGHAQGVPVGVGDWVNAGDVIATVGATGGHDKPGLYFEIRKGANPVDPRTWLRKG